MEGDRAVGPPPGWVDEPVRIEPSRADWPRRFERERAALHAAIGPRAAGGIHHVGSTAVPGLDAKPIIDILVGVDDLDAAAACDAPLAGLGYRHAPYRPDEMRWYCKPDPARRTHHLHLVPTGSPRFAAELAFRDHLRGLPGAAGQYAALKRRLAREHPDDREAYTAGKDAFVADALAMHTVLRSLARWTAAQADGSPSSVAISRPGLTACVTPVAPTRSILNGVTFTDAAALARARQDLAAAYDAAGVRAWTVWVPASERATADLLAGAGHVLDGEPLGMIARLDGLPPLPNAPPGLRCREVPEMVAVAALNDRAYGLPAGTFGDAIGGMGPPSARIYVGAVGDEPVTGCVLVEGEGDAYAGFVATPPEHQGRGYASALLNHALAGARERGCATATLQASAAGAPVYVRLGFRSLGVIALWERRR